MSVESFTAPGAMSAARLAADAGATAPALSRAVALLFSAACGLAVANVYFAQPLLDTMADEFAISHATVGIVMTITQIGYGLGLLDLWIGISELIHYRDYRK